MGEERTEGAQEGRRLISVGEAAKLLGVHRNTVHNRIRAGRISAHKVVEADREVYRIDADSLGLGRTGTGVRTLDAQRPIAGEKLAHLIASRMEELGKVREQLGVERGRREQLQEENEHLRAQLEAERSKGFWARLFGR